MHMATDPLGLPRGRLHHLPPRLREMGPRRVARLVERHEAWATDSWAVARLFQVEIFTRRVLEPGVGLGAIANHAIALGYEVAGWDIFHWGWPGVRLQDFLKAERGDLPWPVKRGVEFSVVQNPPFTKAPAFVSQAMALGARKVASFGKMEFYGTQLRRSWLRHHPPARIWLCGTRATCWRFDVPPERRNGSTPTLHAWFVWERGHTGDPIIRNIWEAD